MKMAAVLISICEDDFGFESTGISSNVIWLIEIDENYSLENVQRCLIDANRNRFGPKAGVRRELGRVKSIKKLLAWADRHGPNRYGKPALTGWHGPVRLDPKYVQL